MARISEIKKNDVVNGVGITVSVWFQGCPHRCKGCFNPETWNFSGGREFTIEDINKIVAYSEEYGINRDLAILGGESLCDQNIEGTIHLCKSFKEKYPHKKIYLWTGYTYETLNDTQKRVLPYLDILVDGRFEKSLKDISLKLRGSKNQRVINVKESLKNNKITLTTNTI